MIILFVVCFYMFRLECYRQFDCGCSGVVVEYRACNREVAGSTHTRSTAGKLEQVVNLLCAQANSPPTLVRREICSSYGYGVKA